jgi:hypothetical protein
MDAFGLTVTICNLCVAKGDEPFKTYAEEGMFDMMEAHTRTAHPEHVEFLRSGGTYRPLVPSPMGGDD